MKVQSVKVKTTKSQRAQFKKYYLGSQSYSFNKRVLFYRKYFGGNK